MVASLRLVVPPVDSEPLPEPSALPNVDPVLLRHPQPTPRRSFMDRVRSVGQYLNNEKGWIASSAVIGVAAKALTASVLAATAPAASAVVVAGTGIAVASLVGTFTRHVKENTDRDYAARIERLKQADDQPGFFRRAKIYSKVFFDHARNDKLEDHLKTKQFWGRFALGAGVSGLAYWASDLLTAKASTIGVAADNHAAAAPACGTSDQVACGKVTEMVVPAAQAVVDPIDPLETALGLLNSHEVSAKAAQAIETAIHHSTSQNIKDAALALLGQHDDVAVELYQKAAEAGNVQAQIDLAFLKFHGLHGVAADPQAALDTMKEIKSPLAREFVSQWTGAHPSHVPPVHVLEHAAAPSAPTASVAAPVAAPVAADIPQVTAVAGDTVTVNPDVTLEPRVALECELNVPDQIAPVNGEVSIKPSCVQHFDDVRAGDSIRLGDHTFTKETGSASSKTWEWAQDKLAWIIGQKVQSAMTPR